MTRLSTLTILCVVLCPLLAAPTQHKDDVKSRSKRQITLDYDIDVDVNLKVITMHPRKSVTIRCRAKGGDNVEDQPYVSFYRQLGDYTHMPMSSGDPGVEVEPSVPTAEDMEFFGEDEGIIKSVKVLTLKPESWQTLSRGDNLFYCKVSTLSGKTQSSYFFVKKSVPRNPQRRPFWRWTIPPRTRN